MERAWCCHQMDSPQRLRCQRKRPSLVRPRTPHSVTPTPSLRAASHGRMLPHATKRMAGHRAVEWEDVSGMAAWAQGEAKRTVCASSSSGGKDREGTGGRHGAAVSSPTEAQGHPQGSQTKQHTFGRCYARSSHGFWTCSASC